MKPSLKKLYKKLTLPSKEQCIKCVVIGDTGVGKTKLISSFVCDKPEIPIAGMNQSSHSPSIFTSDFKESKNLKLHLGKIPVYINVWDTLGYCSNREYSYRKTDVMIICFNIGDPASLKSVTKKWNREVKYYCPKTPIILVGTQLDRRHNDPSLYSPKTNKIKTLREYLSSQYSPSSTTPSSILVDQEQARCVAQEINASLYMEVSVVTKYGVNSLFHNAAQLGLTNRLHADIQKLQQNMLQKPYLPVMEFVPEIKIPSLDPGEIMFSDMFNHGERSTASDVVFKLTDGEVYAESIVLILSSMLFHDLFDMIEKFQSSDMPFTENGAFLSETGTINGSLCYLPRGFESVCTDDGLTVIVISSVSCKVFLKIIEFYYTSRMQDFHDANSILEAADFLQLDLVFEYIFNIITGQTFERKQTLRDLLATNILTTGHTLRTNAIRSDVSIAIDFELLPCHKTLLAQRSPVFKAMFLNNNFSESSVNQVDFRDTNLESFLAVLEYLYTGSCEYYGDLHGTLQLANFLCLPRLLAMCEDEIVKYIMELQENKDIEMFTAAIASYNIAKFHNAPQLATWCLHFMATNYNAFCKALGKEMKSLDATTQKYLEEHRWPPVWYLKEQDYYERTMREIEQEQMLKQSKKRKRKCKTCF